MRSLSALRSNTIRRATNKKAAVAKAQPREEEEEEEAPRNVRSKESRSSCRSRPPSPWPPPEAQHLRDEQQEGERLGLRGAQAARAGAGSEHADEVARAQRGRKKAKILDELAGVDDDDPISGMK